MDPSNSSTGSEERSSCISALVVIALRLRRDRRKAMTDGQGEPEFWRFPLKPGHMALAEKFWRNVAGAEVHDAFATLCLALVYVWLDRHEWDAERDELYAQTLAENVKSMLRSARVAQGRTKLN